MKHIWFCLFFLSAATSIFPVDLLVFSKDRPLQLYAFLESLYAHTKSGLESVNVIYHAKNDRFEYGYGMVKKVFSGATFLAQQRNNPQKDFSTLVAHVFKKTTSEYIVFAVDDIIVTHDIDFARDQKLLAKTNAYGFYYRLGKNITYCYPRNCSTPVPQLMQVDGDVYWYRLSSGRGDWGYPNTLDFALYKKSVILPVLNRLNYFSPNSMEGLWAGTARNVMQCIGLVSEHAKIINVPINMVQVDKRTQGNRCMHAYNPEDLLSLFESGMKIDIIAAQAVKNCSPHVEWDPVFVKR